MFSKAFAVKNLNNDDRLLIDFIRQTYKDVFNVNEDPLTLRTTIEPIKFLFISLGDNEKATNAPSELNFNKEHWRSQIGEDPALRKCCFEIMSIICNYQTEHLHRRGITRNHRGDSSILLLEQIKLEIVKLASGNETQYIELCKQDGQLKRIILFLRRIMVKTELFPQHNNKKDCTRIEVFSSVLTLLEKLSKLLFAKSEATSSYLDLQIAIQKSRQMLELSLEFIHYLFRKSVMPQTFIIDELRHPTHTNEGIKHMSKQLIGNLMQQLLNSESLSLAHPDNKDAHNKLLHKLRERIKGESENILESVFPINEEEYSNSKSNIMILFSQLLKNKANPSVTGVEKGLLNEDILRKFIFLHGLVEEFAASILGCEFLWQNSKDFGDFGVYGILSCTAAYIAKSTQDYIKKIRSTSEDLVILLREYLQKQVSNKTADKIKPWITNFNQSQICLDNFNRIAIDCKDNLAKIQSRAERGITKNEKDEMMENLSWTYAIYHRLKYRRDNDIKSSNAQRPSGNKANHSSYEQFGLYGAESRALSLRGDINFDNEYEFNSLNRL